MYTGARIRAIRLGLQQKRLGQTQRRITWFYGSGDMGLRDFGTFKDLSVVPSDQLCNFGQVTKVTQLPFTMLSMSLGLSYFLRVVLR